jgi:3-hydroxyacyl-[acyl-carrier-protein] dehydratase
MRFLLIDRVLEVSPGRRLVAVKNLSLAEEYLQDHFPSYPVLPGVLMIEAMVQAAAWLQRVTADFAQSLVVLDEVRNIRYGAFFRPGTQMRVTVELLKQADGGLWTFKGAGVGADDQANVPGRFTLKAYNLSDGAPPMAATDRQIVEAMRRRWSLIAPSRSAAAP